ncbi:hypothetical protein [Planotetraspora sp. GP83]|uniref:hypothetical protein n=1 Tax=Planotetraspora sp. GP83 TaxID=3156264 RepID=UPI0035198449
MSTAGPGETAFTPPDPTGLEAWIRQVLRLAGPRASSLSPPLPEPSTAPAEPPPAEDGKQ